VATSLIGEIIACHHCDHRYRYEAIPFGGKASCRRCGALLYLHIPDSLDRCLALYLTALLLFILANSFPFLSLELAGRIQVNTLISGGLAMHQMGMSDLAVLIFLTSIGFPLITIVGMLYLLIPIRLGYKPLALGEVYRLIEAINPWSLVSVFMLGVLISIVKLQDLANVIPGISLYALVGLLITFAAARANFDPAVLWSQIKYRQPDINVAATLVNCHTCGLLLEQKHGLHECPRCSDSLHYRKSNSIVRTWALLFTAAILIIPANLYPVMTVIRFGQGEPSTILSGVVHLISAGMWGLAMIVFVASIVIPVMKLIILAVLLVSVQKKSQWRPRDRTLLYRVTEVVGAWSMVDIFLVGILSALVSLDALSTIRPGIGASFFAGAVIFTMFAAHSFDPRLIWDNLSEKNKAAESN
jgi:paraquat-inducible protein A